MTTFREDPGFNGRNPGRLPKSQAPSTSYLHQITKSGVNGSRIRACNACPTTAHQRHQCMHRAVGRGSCGTVSKCIKRNSGQSCVAYARSIHRSRPNLAYLSHLSITKFIEPSKCRPRAKHPRFSTSLVLSPSPLIPYIEENVSDNVEFSIAMTRRRKRSW